MKIKKIDLAWYFGVGIPLYIMIILGLMTIFPQVNFYGGVNSSTQYYSNAYPSYLSILSWRPSTFFAPFFVIAGILGFVGIIMHFILSGRYKK